MHASSQTGGSPFPSKVGAKVGPRKWEGGAKVSPKKCEGGAKVGPKKPDAAAAEELKRRLAMIEERKKARANNFVLFARDRSLGTPWQQLISNLQLLSLPQACLLLCPKICLESRKLKIFAKEAEL